MALSGAVLGGLIKDEVKSILETTEGLDEAALKKFCDAVAKAVVQHITSAAIVNTNVTTTLTGVVTSGLGAGGVVTGTGTGTGIGTVS